MELKAGMRVSCEICDTLIKDAKIQEECGGLYICQNVKNGGECKDKLGYKYSWFICYEEIHNFKIISDNIEELYEGAIVENINGKRKVLGICGEIIFLSSVDRFDKIPYGSSNFTMSELKDFGYSLQIEEDLEDDGMVDVTVEGITTRISRTSAKALNLIK